MTFRFPLNFDASEFSAFSRNGIIRDALRYARVVTGIRNLFHHYRVCSLDAFCSPKMFSLPILLLLLRLHFCSLLSGSFGPFCTKCALRCGSLDPDQGITPGEWAICITDVNFIFVVCQLASENGCTSSLGAYRA